MPDYRLIVQIEGPDSGDGDVRLDDFIGFLLELRTALHATDRLLSHEDEPTTYYSVADLSKASPSMVALAARKRDPELDYRDKIFGTFVGGLRDINAGNLPPGFGPRLLIEYRDLAKRLGRLRQARFSHSGETVEVSGSLREKIEEIIGRDRPEKGAVSGRVDVINVHGGRRFFWLYPPGGQRIQCYFQRHLLGEVGAAIGRHVTVNGTLVFKPKTLQPFRIRASGIDVHEPDSQLPSLSDVRGVAPGATEESAEEFVRKLRDAWR